MREQFCDYEIAFALKELGFDEECCKYYHYETLSDFIEEGDLYYFRNSVNKDDDICSAPLWQQVIDWIREKHDLHIEVDRYTGENGIHIFIGWIYGDFEEEDVPTDKDYKESYFEAKRVAILEAIEVIKNERTSN